MLTMIQIPANVDAKAGLFYYLYMVPAHFVHIFAIYGQDVYDCIY